MHVAEQSPSQATENADSLLPSVVRVCITNESPNPEGESAARLCLRCS